VLPPPPHWMPYNTSAATSTSCDAASSAANANREAAATTPASSTGGDHIVPLRLQCRILELGEGLASRQEKLLLQNCSQGLPTGKSGSTCSNNFSALQLRRWLPRLLPLLDKAMVCGQVGMVLQSYGTRLSYDSSTPLR